MVSATFLSLTACFPYIMHANSRFCWCRCFSHQFPNYHQHPRSSFAVQSIMNADESGPVPVKGELVSTYEKDVVDVDYQSDTEDQELLRTDMPLESDKGYAYLKRWAKRKICSFCNDDDTSGQYGGFIGPFRIATVNRRGEEKKRTFWVHDACARYSPEVFATKENEWYNVTAALRRGRGMVKFFYSTMCSYS